MPSAGTYSRFSWPLDFASTNNAIRVTVNGVAGTITISPGTYLWLDDKGLTDLAKALDNALSAHAQTPVVSTSLTASGRLVILSSKTLTIHWGDALTTADPAWFGFTAENYEGIAPNYTVTSPNQVGHLWNPERIYVDDTGIYPEHIVDRAVSLSGHTGTYLLGSRNYRDITVDLLPAGKIFTADAPLNEGFDLFYGYLATGGVFTWTRDISTPLVNDQWVIRDTEWLTSWPVERIPELNQRWKINIPMQGV